MNIYGMRLRGFSIGCQPKEGFVDRQDDPTGKYYDILIYDRKLTDKELAEYELDYLGMEAEAMKDDLISRQAAINALDCINGVEEVLKALPPAQPEVLACGEGVLNAQPETARRIVGKSRNGMTLWYQCEMCNEPVDAQDNFCRGCGRRLTDE